MPNAIKSIGAGICDRCGQAYNLGDLLTYSIKRPGESYHFPSCIDAVLSGAVPCSADSAEQLQLRLFIRHQCTSTSLQSTSWR